MTDLAPPGARGAAPQDAALAAVFPGASEMARRCRALDWAATPLGPVAGWPARLRAVAGLVLAAPVGMVVLWGPDLVQLYNDAYRDVMGAKHPAGLGQPTRDCWPEVWAFNAPLYAGVKERGETFTFTDQRLVLERHGAPEAAFFTLTYSGVPDDAGGVGGVLVTVFETTAQVRGRAAEAERARLAAAMEAERAGVLEEVFRRSPSFLHVLRGPDFVFEFANEAYHRLVGRRDLVGRPAFEAMPEAAAGGFPERIARVMATGEPFEGRELPVTLARTPGAPPEERLIDLVYLPLPDADGTCTRVLGHGTDVTEHVRARRATEAALAERTATAEAANRAKSDFLAVMSHELRTPLNAIGGYAQLLELGLHGPVTPEQLAALGRIQRGQQHLLGLINAVLNYAKLEAGHVEYYPADVPAAELVAEVAALVAPQARAKGLTLAAAPCAPGRDGAPLVARADPEKARQVLLNLLANAVKFTRGGGTVTVGCGPAPGGDAAADAAPGRVAFTVTDTGRGIALDQLGRVFEPFVQVDQRLTRTEEGTGLGLAISRDLARGMGGDLTAESTPGVGSTFTLTLPAA